MAEQELQNASIDEPLATPEQQEPAPKVTRRGKRQNAENGTRKRSSTRKTTPGAVEAPAPATNGASGAHGTAPKKARSKKQPRPVDVPVSTNGDVALDTSPPRPRKRRSSRKPASTTKRGTTTSIKKQPQVQEPEPDLEPTPVKARETRSLASLEAELELEAPPSELEDTMERPPLHLPYRLR